MRAGDRVAIAATAFVAACLAFLVWAGQVEGGLASVILSGATVLVIVWYTVETARLRREADRRAQYDTEPVLAINLKLQLESFGDGAFLPSPIETKQAGRIIPVRFLLENKTRNRCYVRAFVRLRTSDGTGAITEGAYSGRDTWDITAHDSWDGWFDLLDLILAAQGRPHAAPWPDADMSLDVQAFIYDRTRRFRWSYHREYHVNLDLAGNSIQVWPEIRPQAFSALSPPVL